MTALNTVLFLGVYMGFGLVYLASRDEKNTSGVLKALLWPVFVVLKLPGKSFEDRMAELDEKEREAERKIEKARKQLPSETREISGFGPVPPRPGVKHPENRDLGDEIEKAHESHNQEPPWTLKVRLDDKKTNTIHVGEHLTDDDKWKWYAAAGHNHGGKIAMETTNREWCRDIEDWAAEHRPTMERNGNSCLNCGRDDLPFPDKQKVVCTCGMVQIGMTTKFERPEEPDPHEVEWLSPADCDCGDFRCRVVRGDYP